MGELAEQVQRLVSPLISRVAAIAKRAIVERTNDKEKRPLIQVSLRSREVADKAEYFHAQGVYFRPPTDAEAAVLCPGGDTSHVLVMCASKREDRPTDVDEGQGGLYEPGGTWIVFLPGDGTVNLTSKDPSDNLSLSSLVDQRIKDVEDWVIDYVNQVFNAHTHSTSVGPSGPPTPTATPPTNGSSTKSEKVKAD